MTLEPKTHNREFAACTIVAKNYLPMARVLAESWNQFHPDSPFFVLFLDNPDGFFAPEAESFESVYTSDLDIPNLQGFLFKYTVLEASTAVKPYLLSYLFREYGIHKLLYIDPDILIFNSLSNLSDYLESSDILLTPHLLEPIPNDGRRQTEHDILKSGTFNLGFIGLRNGIESERLLRWWSDKLYHHCIVSIEQNLFVDQRWMDFAPSLFNGVRIIREPGYNIAYWNLHERVVTLDDGVKVNGSEPVYFVHFSGFDADKPWIVSKHQDRFGMTDIGELQKLYLRYRDLLMDQGWEEAKRWTYGLDFFASGVRIPSSARRYYWSLGPNVAHLGDPFLWLDIKSEQADTDEEDLAASFLAGGVNLVGYYGAETGVGEGARSNLRIIQASGVPFSVTSHIDPRSSNVEVLPDGVTDHNPYLANLITINADGLVPFAQKYAGYLKGHFNIGYWAWELSEFPREWAKSFGYLDEVWTPSRFTRDAVASSSPIPVRVVPHAMDLNSSFDSRVDRSKFGLQSDSFVFLFYFDFESYLERKNPLGLIEAFKRAFGPRQDVLLLIKSVHGTAHPEALKLLQKAADGSNVRIFDTILSRNDKHELMMAADCYVSLHRSEGFGLTMAEAMMCGKPVIATAYSGNVDFMSDEDSFLVPYRTVTIKRSCGPYKAGCHWADPDLDCAADAMRLVEANRESAAERGLIAQNKVSKLLHPATIATSVRSRLEELGLLAEALPASR